MFLYTLTREVSMVPGLDTSSYRISTFLMQNKRDIGRTLLRMSTGKKVNTPADNPANYVRAQDLRLRYTGYENVKTELQEWESALNIASDSSGEVLDSLNRMQELIYLAAQDSATSAELDAYQNEFYTLATSMESLVDNTNYEGTSLMNNAGTIASISLEPGSSTYALDLAPGVAVDSGAMDDLTTPASHALNLTDTERDAAQTDVTAALEDIKSYIGQIAGLQSSVQSQIRVAESTIENTKASESVLMDINEAEEMVTYTEQDIQQQAAMAMLSQANMSRKSVLMLYGFGMS
ncbi:MAG: hypothetical protein GF398_12915 [Chitinivibrionales bacterium]|nr:hypothetical protein [Chitinivibrionales bacterium]